MVDQWTGIKDKNEVDVYQRDNVKAHKFYFDGNFDNDYEFIGTISWDNNADAQWAIVTEDSYYGFRETSHFESGESIEVIGNTHEDGE